MFLSIYLFKTKPTGPHEVDFVGGTNYKISCPKWGLVERGTCYKNRLPKGGYLERGG